MDRFFLPKNYHNCLLHVVMKSIRSSAICLYTAGQTEPHREYGRNVEFSDLYFFIKKSSIFTTMCVKQGYSLSLGVSQEARAASLCDQPCWNGVVNEPMQVSKSFGKCRVQNMYDECMVA